MGGVLSCGGHGYQPDGDDCRPYGSCVPQQNGEVVHSEDITTDVSTPIKSSNNNNNVEIKYKFNDNTNHRPSWKFWQRGSLRRSSRKLQAPEVNKKPNIVSETDANIILPDVVDSKQDIKRTSSLRPPPKPPRLFLFRSSSINTPRSSVVGATDRNSFVFSEAYQTGSGSDGKINSETDKPCELETHIKANKQQETAAASKANVEVNIEGKHVPLAMQKCNSLPQQRLATGFQDVIVTRRQHPMSSTGKIKIISPDLSRKATSRLRKKSGEITSEDRHILIMQSTVELICQKLDPFVIIEELAEVNILSKEDLSAFRGHPDRRLICENIVQSVMDRDYASFLIFCDVLRAKTDYTTVAAVLDAMKAVYDVIHTIPTNMPETSSSILDDEKSVSFEVVYYSTETGKIRSVVELEKSRNVENKRHSRDMLAYKRNSRLSFHSLTSEASSVFNEDIITNGIPMVTAAIAGHSLYGEKAKALAAVLEKHSCVLELHVGKTQMTGPDMEHIAKSLHQNTSLRVLDLRLNSIGNEGAAYISNVLLNNRGLKQLNLSSTGIDAEGCKLLAAALRKNDCLIELDLSFLDIGDTGCLAISDALKQNRCLKKLRLRSDSITWIGCGFLLEGIEQGKTVTELDLSRNFIGDEGAEMFLRHMKDDSCLRELNLENCGFTSAGCSTISDVMLTNKSLRNLDLSVNFIGDQGVIRLSNALVRNKHIRTLGLNMCGISNDGFSKLLDILESNPTLNLLKLCYNRLGREHTNPEATSDNLKYRIRIVTSSNRKLKLLLWGNTFDESHFLPQITKDLNGTL